MKKSFLSVMMILILVFTLIPCNKAFAASKAPTNEELKEICFFMGSMLMMQEDPYFEPNDNVDPAVALDYFYMSGKLERFFDEDTWTYELASSHYMNLMKSSFAHYSQTEILNWLESKGYYDKKSGRVTLDLMYGFGGEYGFQPISIKKNSAGYVLDGLYLCGSEETGDVLPTDKEFFGYWKYDGKQPNGRGDAYDMKGNMFIKDSYRIELVNTASGVKIASFKNMDSYTYNGKSYYQNGSTGRFDQSFKFSLSANKLTHSGKALTKPKVVVKDKDNKAVAAKSGYTLSWSNATLKAVGRYSVTVKLKAPYNGTQTLYFTVVPSAPGSAKAVLNSYNGVTFSWAKSTGAKGYSVYYKKTAEQKYTFFKRTTGTSVKVNNLAGNQKYNFKVVPYYTQNNVRYDSVKFKTVNATTLKKVDKPAVVKSNMKAKVSWKDLQGESGYQICKAQKKNGKYLVVKNYTTTKTSILIPAEKGKTFHYKVRAYKTIGKEKVYGPWSAYKSFTRK